MLTPRDRDRGLRRVSTATQWLVGGAVVGAGLFAALLARPHDTTVTTNTTTDATTSSGAAVSGSGSAVRGATPAPRTQTQRSGRRRPSAVSGGS